MTSILIGFEESQTVCLEFFNIGFEAYSNDLIGCSGGRPDRHLQMDVQEAMGLKKWKFIGLHPVCTKLALSGNRHYAPGKPRHRERIDAIEWTIGIWEKACSIADYVYMENPMGAMNGDPRLPKPQIIQPWYFGDSFQKTTCLWLKGLPPLQHFATDTLFEKKTHVYAGDFVTFPSGKRMAKWFAETSSTRSEKNRGIRSKTFPGIARAMAEQWGPIIK